jgi:2-oxoglutarate ferredoxin oxidoreductase subunit delta
MTRKKTVPDKPAAPEGTGQKKKGEAKKFDVSFFHSWCKQCGLCMAFCPRKIIKGDKTGRPEITDQDRCSGCRFCEIHCPDFAITVKERCPRRRKTDE